MSLHKSLQSGNTLARHRNVLTRVERLAKLEQENRWNEEQSILGIPKVRSIKVVAKKKKKEEAASDEATTEAVSS